MIKINVITNDINWLNYIKNPNSYLDRKIKKINLKDKKFIKNKIFCTLLLSGSKEIKIIEFDHNDVVRHPLVSKIIRAYQNKSTDDKN